MINYFIEQKSPSWSSQFKQAVMLCPKVDEDDLIVSQVEMGEALNHFATIGWKVLFALIPPCEYKGGWPAFFVALIFIYVRLMNKLENQYAASHSNHNETLTDGEENS